MGFEYRLDDQLLIISLLSLAIAIVSIGASFVGMVQGLFTEILIISSLLIYGITFTLFLYYNHELEKDEYAKKGRLDIQNPYKITLYFGIFLFLIGLIGNMIESHMILMALTSGGLFAIVYSVAGLHDLRSKKS